MVTQIYKFMSKIPLQKMAAEKKTSKFRRDFRQLRDLMTDYLQNATTRISYKKAVLSQR